MTEDERLEAAARRELPETDSSPSAERPAGVERRRHSRLAISVDVMLRRRSPGAPAEERTVTDNISRGGARVLTGMTDLKPGDTLGLKEVGGDFETEAVVRNTLVGPDRIPRLGIEFLGRAAPDRLVPSGEATPRAKRGRDTRPPGVAAEPGVEELRRQILELHGSMGTKTHYELLGVARDARESEVKKAYLALARQYHPDATRDERLSDMRREVEAIFVRLGQAYDVLRDVEKRASYERQLGTAAKAEAKPPDSPPPPAPPAETEEQRQLRLETLLNDARAHIAAGRFWEAIQLLEPAVAQTEGTRLSLPVRLLLGQATGKNPNWLKRAEELLLGVVRDAPENAEAQFQLGKLYQQAGLAQRARAALRKALELNPGHGEAKDALQALGGDERKTTRTRMRSPKKP
jgi:tetratricopeptide (TPR) repeat protein